MIAASNLKTAIDLLLSALFIGIATYVFFFAGATDQNARRDLVLYSALTGAYGVWRLIRVLLAKKNQEENV
ncbi:MAG: hypothetical protein HGA81_07045 [Chlorobium limicola]|nr:hypothetical protein [Chlorobium limicola]